MKTQSGKIRIISGENKGRRLQFPAVVGLRPTPERIRETLFNWLMPYITDSICLDLFAGSGALGFEALSRGANSTTFVEANKFAAQCLENNIQRLNLSHASVYNQDSIKYLKHSRVQFDIVFLDPPFNSNLLDTTIDLINQNQLIRDNAWVYLEYSVHQPQPDCPQHWSLYRQTKAGDANACLFQIFSTQPLIKRLNKMSQ